ncbi:WRKY domain-containing protein [Heracleum sosnowskyi]|uniref:WRKY domain-containing protein n=1 Tax=Heracleum sosnowskyi TaxID=360622 RepID=A0AAD8HHS2_9APIA|nr:WRKY domain-containing protein [Heracleum sosnowskyi]
MEGFCGMEEDWGLQAIVRGCTHDQYATINGLLDFNYQDDLFYDFPDFQGVEINNDNSPTVNELDDLYKPFYDLTAVQSFSPQILEHADSPVNEVKFEQEDLKVVEQKESIVVAGPKVASTQTTKYKRKNQQKRVVVQVTAEGLSSDLWAWRKYGQKPIKGSPYPRSYYRCSSSKGCLARKQVEESYSNPGMFIITYSAEHNHSQPTRRSSLAGTNRQKFSALKRTSSGESCVSSTAIPKESIPIDEVHVSKKIKHEKKDRTLDDEQLVSGDDHEFVIPDSILTDDFFAGFDEDLDGLVSNASF